MAQRALPPGAVRRRTAFGLFAVDGWAWASIKATFWFLVIIFVLGYLPDRAYYFTVSPTLDFGYNVISPVNWCSEANRGLPCPAPAGAVVPWEVNPPTQALPEPRAGGAAFNAAENMYLAGGRTPGGVTASVVGTVVEEGLFSPWQEAPALPAPRADAAVAIASGTPYLIGGIDGDGNPTPTVLRGTITEGLLSGWEEVPDLALPVALTDASAVATVRGIYLFGGRVDGAPSQTVYVSAFDTAATPRLTAWTEVSELPLPEPRASASAVLVASFIYVLAGEGPEGASNSVFFLALDRDGAPEVDESTGRPQGWGVAVGPAAAFALPEPRTNHTSFSNSGAVYVIGGLDADGAPAVTNFWALPDPVDGTIPAWNRLTVSDLPEARSDAAAVPLGSHVFLIGGEAEAGPSDATYRANLAPARPFFRLGLFGITVPALGIPGQVGQELGYIAAGSVGVGMFILLMIVAIAYSHQAGTLRFIERISRGRFRAPRDEEAY